MAQLIQLYKSPIHGNGVIAVAEIPAGRRLVEYVGEVITQTEATRRYGGSADDGHTFLFTLTPNHVIDANVNGNLARWINHSCAPNCEALVDTAPGKDRRRDRIFIHSLRPIAKGEELTYDYGIVLEERHTARMKKIWQCRCGAPECTGTMLKPKPRGGRSVI